MGDIFRVNCLGCGGEKGPITAEYFVDVFEERRSLGRPPSWSDGGESTPTFILHAR